jgi:D-beta-D-heptose 7-phosphate kinase/D-beta-D-heptose 1-phosphate adenosyltransferase
MSDHLAGLLENAGRPEVLVVGDLMLDRYVRGEVERVSPEGPIPVLEVTSEEDRPGGAGNVVSALAKLEANVAVCGVVGKDHDGERLRQLLVEMGADAAGVVADPGRPTSVKTRYLGYVQSAGRAMQHVLRADRESRDPLSAEMEKELLRRIEAALPSKRAVVLSDYNKGALTERVMGRVIELARKKGIPVVTDPKIGRSYSVYKGSTILTPNRYETQLATGIAPKDAAARQAAAKALIEAADLQYALITLDRDGMYLAGRDGEGRQIPTRAREVYDVTGAGDVVVSVLALMLAAGTSVLEAATLANTAAGIEVTRVGATPISREEIIADLLQGGASVKVKSLGAAVELARECRRRNGKVVWTNGCFDIFHIGHYEYLSFAKRQGDVLIVGLNSDESVRRLKGPNRPITSEGERARILAALDVVDAVVIFDEDTPIEAIKAIRPDVIVKGGDYREDQVVGADFVKEYGGRVALAPIVEGASTTSIVERILERHKET